MDQQAKIDRLTRELDQRTQQVVDMSDLLFVNGERKSADQWQQEVMDLQTYSETLKQSIEKLELTQEELQTVQSGLRWNLNSQLEKHAEELAQVQSRRNELHEMNECLSERLQNRRRQSRTRNLRRLQMKLDVAHRELSRLDNDNAKLMDAVDYSKERVVWMSELETNCHWIAFVNALMQHIRDEPVTHTDMAKNPLNRYHYEETLQDIKHELRRTQNANRANGSERTNERSTHSDQATVEFARRLASIESKLDTIANSPNNRPNAQAGGDNSEPNSGDLLGTGGNVGTVRERSHEPWDGPG